MKRSKTITKATAKKPRTITAPDDNSREREVVAMAARERRRFGDELHQGLSQQLTGLKFKLSLLEHRLRSQGVPEADDAKALSELLDAAADAASRLIRSTRMFELEPRGLPAALRDLAANTTDAHAVQCRFEMRRRAFIGDAAAATNVYHIAEEAVANALQHGEATKISIALKATNGRAILTVRDNGRGLPPEFSEDGGLGLRLMRYRARLLGGSIQLEGNAIGSGVTVICHFNGRINRSGR